MKKTKGGFEQAWAILCQLLVKKGKADRKSDGTYVIEQEWGTRDMFARVLTNLDYAKKQEKMELTQDGKRICKDPMSFANEWEAIYREVAQNMRWRIIERMSGR